MRALLQGFVGELLFSDEVPNLAELHLVSSLEFKVFFRKISPGMGGRTQEDVVFEVVGALIRSISWQLFALVIFIGEFVSERFSKEFTLI